MLHEIELKEISLKCKRKRKRKPEYQRLYLQEKHSPGDLFNAYCIIIVNLW